MTFNEKVLFRKQLETAKIYFEYGCGGSTQQASLCKSLENVTSVESDPSWIQKVVETCNNSKLQVIHANIGPTKALGYPKKAGNQEMYSKAFDQRHPNTDLVLIDGRFRVACAAYVAQFSDAIVLIHDFWNRPQYKVVLELYDVVDRVDTLAVLKRKTGCDEKARTLWNRYKNNAQ